MRALFYSLVASVWVGCQCGQEGTLIDVDAPTDAPVFPGDPAGNHGSWLSFDTAPDDTRLTMAYYDRELGALGYAVGLPSEDLEITWVHERVDGYPASNGLDSTDAGRYASQRTAPDGTVWIGYQQVDDGVLRVAHRQGPGLWDEPVDLEPGGAWASLQIGAAGEPVIAHCNPATAQVRVMRFDGDGWTGSTVFSSTAVGERPAGVSHTRLLVADGAELLAFRDDAAGALMLADLGTGELTVVDQDGDVGAWPSLTMAGDSLVIAYHDVGRQDLRVATRNAEGAWHRQVVDDGALRGADTEVFVLDGSLAVVYFDGHDNNMMLARRGTDGWSTEVIGADGALGYHNEVVRAAGHWWAGSYDHTGRTLFVRAL